MSAPLRLIVNSFHTGESLILTEQELHVYDRYIDESLENGDLIKHDKYDFTGFELANKVNQKLEVMKSKYRVEALKTNDSRINTRVKGQGVYFLRCEINNDSGIPVKMDKEIGIMTWCENALTFFPMHV